MRFYIVGFSTLFDGLLFASFPKENIAAELEGCFPTSVDDTPSKDFGIDYCVSPWGIGTRHLLAGTGQIPNNIVDNWLIEPLGLLLVLLQV